jgi:hypothetical protein
MTWDMSKWEVWSERILGDKVVCIARRHVWQWRYEWMSIEGWICKGRDRVDLERC